MQQELIFTLTIEEQDMVVRYRLRYFSTVDYAHFEFTSPHEPRRRIPVSETGYRSHFAPMWEIAEAPSVEAYARAVARAIMGARPSPDDDDKKECGQLALF